MRFTEARSTCQYLCIWLFITKLSEAGHVNALPDELKHSNRLINMKSGPSHQSLPDAYAHNAGDCCAQQDNCPGDEQGNNDNSENMDSVQQPEGVGSHDHIWYQSTISLKGITQVSSQPMDIGGFM